MKYPMSYLLLCAFISACNVGNNTTELTGTVFDMNHQEYVGGKTVNVIRTETPLEPFSPLIETIIETVETNSDGYYEINAELINKSKYDYRVEVDLNGLPHVGNGWSEGSYQKSLISCDVEPGNSESCELKYLHTGRIEFHLINESYSDLSFQATLITPKTAMWVYEEEVVAGEESLPGSDVKIISGPSIIEWHVSNDSISDTITQAIDPEPGEITTIVFEYP